MNKDEMIEDMTETIAETWINDLDGNPHNFSEILWECDIESIARELYNANYRKVADDEIVIKKSEYVVIPKQDWEKMNNLEIEKAIIDLVNRSKEIEMTDTARAIFDEAIRIATELYIDLDDKLGEMKELKDKYDYMVKLVEWLRDEYLRIKGEQE